LRENIPDESIDLIYLDPPFNSQANYNIFFKNSTGKGSEAQITAFEDTWTWGIESERFLDEIQDIKGELYQLLDLLVRTLGKNSLSAYLVMMAIRLIELHRVLKSTGSLYLHCDTTASHYLKMILDLIFDARNFRNQITWKRTSSHSDAKKYARITDIIFYYVKTNEFTWNPQRLSYSEEYIKQYYCNIDSDGRRFQFGDLTKPKGSKGYFYKLLDCNPPKNGWRMPEYRAQEWLIQGKIAIPPTGKTPRYKRYLDEVEGKIIPDIWDDIPPINSQAKEALGYPTQKPLTLLDRIIQVSSNENDIILDPFCGCGTAIHAAENLGRNWIGIDITHLAISLIEKRLRDAFPNKFIEDENKNQKLVPGIEFEVEGTPKDLAAAIDLFNRDAYQFQWWACSLVNAQPYKDKKKGADGGIDGLIFFEDVIDMKKSNKTAVKKIIVSVKGGKNINPAMIRDLRGTMETNKAEIGLFVTLTPPTQPMIKEAASSGFYKAGNGRNYDKIQILTIEELLNGEKKPEFFDMKQGELTFKKAQRENQDMGEQGELF
ncbi:MAG: DNA methyltransferase, partial [Dolichospermum sp.]